MTAGYKNRNIFALAVTLCLLTAQAFAFGHALEHALEGHQEACSICLDATQFGHADAAPGQIAIVPSAINESAIPFSTASYTKLVAAPYASRAPPFFS